MTTATSDSEGCYCIQAHSCPHWILSARHPLSLHPPPLDGNLVFLYSHTCQDQLLHQRAKPFKTQRRLHSLSNTKKNQQPQGEPPSLVFSWSSPPFVSLPFFFLSLSLPLSLQFHYHPYFCNQKLFFSGCLLVYLYNSLCRPRGCVGWWCSCTLCSFAQNTLC